MITQMTGPNFEKGWGDAKNFEFYNFIKTKMIFPPFFFSNPLVFKLSSSRCKNLAANVIDFFLRDSCHCEMCPGQVLGPSSKYFATPSCILHTVHSTQCPP